MATRGGCFDSGHSSLMNITILVVDDDATTLSMVSAMLRSPWFKGSPYVRVNIATVKDSIEALSTIRIHRNIDLVISDLHMPRIDGIELKKQIDQEFKLPVVFMSSDDKESVILNALACGAVSYIVKPMKRKDLQNIWQLAIYSKKGKSIIIEDVGIIPKGLPSMDMMPNNGKIHSPLTVEVEREKTCTDDGKKGRKRKAPPKKGMEANSGDLGYKPRKKPKVVWSNSLHSLFLQAIRYLGLKRAVPKKILELMNVPGLTRENVASHLQKYRIFLKKVAQSEAMSSKSMSRAMSSTFGINHFGPSLISAKKDVSQQEYLQFGATSSNTLVSQLGYSPSNLLRSQASSLESLFEWELPPFNAPNCLSFSMGSCSLGSNLQSKKGSSSRKYGRNKIPTSLKQNESKSKFLHPNISSTNTRILSPSPDSYDSETKSIEFTNNSFTNYAGIQISGNGGHVGVGQSNINCNNRFGCGVTFMNNNFQETHFNTSQGSPMFLTSAQQAYPQMLSNTSEHGSALAPLDIIDDHIINDYLKHLGDGDDLKLSNLVMSTSFELNKLSLGSMHGSSEVMGEISSYRPTNNQAGQSQHCGGVGMNPNTLINSSSAMDYEMNQLLNPKVPIGDNSLKYNQALSQDSICQGIFTPQKGLGGYCPTMNNNNNIYQLQDPTHQDMFTPQEGLEGYCQTLNKNNNIYELHDLTHQSIVIPQKGLEGHCQTMNNNNNTYQQAILSELSELMQDETVNSTKNDSSSTFEILNQDVINDFMDFLLDDSSLI